MAVASSEKIFVDPKEEITSVIERVLASDKDKVIIVIPQSSLVLSSPVSINILNREIANTKKAGILVTEDEYGTNMANKIGMVVVPKVSYITAEVWDKAIKLKLAHIDKSAERRKGLLTDMGLMGHPDQSDDVKQQNVDETRLENTLNDQPVEDSVDIETGEDTVHAEEERSEAEKDELDEALKVYRKPRVEPKEISINGIKVIAGGDVRSFRKAIENDRIDEHSEENMDEVPDRKINMNPQASLVGKDFTRAVKGGSGVGGFFTKLFKKNSKPGRDEEFSEDLLEKKRKKKVTNLIILAAIVMFVSIGAYLLAFQFSSADIIIRYKKTGVDTTANILASKDAAVVSYDPITIPAIELKEEKLSASKTGEATGTGTRGNKASGFVTIYNLTTETVVLPTGTKLTNESTGKEYQLKSDVSLSPATVQSGGVLDSAFFVKNIPIEAVELGAESNIPFSTTSPQRLTVDGYQGFTEVYASIEGAIDGGTSQQFTAVSKENIDKLKEQIIPELKARGESRIRNSVTTGYTLIIESIEFTETTVSSFPKEGEEAADKTFTLTVEGTITALQISNANLQTVAEKVITQNAQSSQGQNDTVIVDTVTAPKIAKAEKSASGMVLTISTSGEVGVRYTNDDIKNAIAGKSVGDASTYLSTVPGQEDYRINFSPAFIPDFLKRIPTDNTRINVSTR